MLSYTIVFAFQISILNLIRHRKDYLSLQPSRLPQRRMILNNICRWNDS